MSGGAPTSRLAYQPALDGVRALAVTLVLLFHAGYSWLSGGYVGVSVFFTLSGYLITSILIAEFDRSGGISLRTFYGRRVRRLLPASLACCAGVMVFAAAGAFRAVPHLTRSLWTAVLQVANWGELSQGDSYAALISRRTGQLGPFDHFWSLAIEEQFYWLWPIAALLLLRAWRRPRARAAAVCILAAVFSAAAPLIAAGWGADAAYWATPARLGEILLGAALAAVLACWARRPAAMGWLAPAGLIGIVATAHWWPSASGPAYHGWLPVFALASVALIAGLQVPSPLRRLLSTRPFVALGMISYGVYLYHWPIYALVNDARFDLGRTPLFALRLAITLAVATVSYFALERPIRRGAALVPRRLWGLAGAGGVAVAAIVVLAAMAPTAFTEDFSHDPNAAAAAITPQSSLPAPDAGGSAPTPATPTTQSHPDGPMDSLQLTRPLRIVVVGDSTAQATSVGLSSWAVDHPALAQVTFVGGPGCGLQRDGHVRADTDGTFDRICDAKLGADFDTLLHTLQPDVVVVMVTISDLEDRRWTTQEGYLDATDPRFIERESASYAAFAQRVMAAGVGHIAWIQPPPPTVMYQGDQRKMDDPARYAIEDRIMAALTAKYPQRMGLIALDRWLADIGGQNDTYWRPDGMHWDAPAARRVVDDFLAAQLLALALRR